VNDTTVVKAEKKEKPVRFTPCHGTVEEFISSGVEEIQEVGNELREAFDNSPESLQQTDVNQRREAAASEIENISEPSVSSSILGELDCSTQIDNGKLYRGRMSQSRVCRLANGAAKLRAAAEAINEWLGNSEEIEDADPDDPDSLRALADALDKLGGADVSDYNSAREEAETLAGECEEIADMAENLDVPGMFG
jgi:hypothetical protein